MKILINRKDSRASVIMRRIVDRRTDGSMLVEYIVPAGVLFADKADSALTPEGFLRAAGRIMRDGWLQYSDGQETWGEFRSADEVDKSLDSFRNLPITVGHPDAFLTPDNVDQFQVGQLGSNIARDPELKDHILSDVLITGRKGLDAIQDGVVELSIGFSAVVIPERGTDAHGRAFRFVQTDIRGNHVAIVERGRAGKDARLILDAKGKTMKLADILKLTKITNGDAEHDDVSIEIGGVAFVVPRPVAELIEQLMANQKEPDPEAEPGTAAPDQEPGDPTPKPASVGAQAPAAAPEQTDAATQAKLDAQDVEINALKKDKAIRDRKVLLDKAAHAGVAIDTAKDKTDAAIMRTVVLDLEPDLKAKLDEHADSADYLLAMFERVIDKADRDLAGSVRRAGNAAVIASRGDVAVDTDWLANKVKADAEAAKGQN